MIAEELTDIDSTEDTEGEAEEDTKTSWFVRSPLAIYGSLAVAGIGFVVIAVTWGLVAGTAEVARQIPYLISGGLTGIGLVIVGIGLLIVAIRIRESEARKAQYEELAALMRETSGPKRRGRR